MAQFCNPEKEGQQGQQVMEKVPSGFGAPGRVSVASHGVLYSGWQPNPERTVMSAPWFRVECCTRWPALNESYINGLCGHRIHEGCILTLQQPYRMEACPVCCSHTTHFEREGWFLYVLPVSCWAFISWKIQPSDPHSTQSRFLFKLRALSEYPCV